MAQVDVIKKPAFGRRAVRTFLEPRVLAPVIAMVLLSILVVVPLATMIIAAFRPAGILPLAAGGFTTENFVTAYTGSDLFPIIKNTLIYAGGGVLFALPLAFTMAFLTERTDMPFRNSMYTLMFIPMSTPVFATSLGWVLLLGPRAGTINQYLRLMVGSDSLSGPINIFSMGGLIFVHVLGVVPSMWLFLISVLRNMDPVLEEAASTAGSSKWRIMRRITIPLMLPGVTAVFIYFFISGIESLEHPLALGPTAGIETLSTKIFFTLLPTADAGRNYGIPAAIGMLGLALGLVGMGAYLYMVRRASSYAVVAGKGFRPRTLRLGNWKWLALGFVGLYMAVKVVLPFGMLIYTSFLKFYMPPVPRLFDQIVWTTNNYERLLDYRFFGRYFVNSFVVAIMAAFITMLLVSFISWMVVRYPSPLTRLVNILAFMPLAIPGIISTIAFFLLFIG
ncbi:MAG: ABC transporter permease subunit, partial [Chloroflexi bacterium]|nr:ABC transporter permease subunit [Chloroflexota bacterium]